MKLPKGIRWVMIGDSITDCGRTRPIGEGGGESMGKGYVMLTDAAINAVYPERAIRITNMGISGNTVRHLKERWQTDVIDLKPDWLSIKIGINDVWRQFDSPRKKEVHVHIDEYEQTLRELIERTLPMLKGLILLTPYFIEPNRREPMRAMMDQYGQVVKKLAQKYSAICVDTQAAFDQVMEQSHPLTLAGDRVHPNFTGHMIIARALLKAIEFQW